MKKDAAQLVEETEELCRKSQKMLQEYRNHSKGHLAVLTILLTTTDTINATQMPFIVGFIAYENIFVFAVHLI
ncbi:hypothetical protein TYRP_014989 [Tyrophagus putrescentiae]|nr:hypothetical protein TYRP_014989 [Tyrophagus putrescentiae]